MLLRPAERFLFIGDSITDCGRGHLPPDWTSGQELGDGYVRLVHSALTAVYPDYGIRVLNAGVAGDTVRDLKARWGSDVLRLRPTWLSVMIGINDVWQHFGPPSGMDALIAPEEFGRSLDEIVQHVRAGLHGLVLMTPYYLETNRDEPMRSLMDRFGQLVRQAALRHNAVLVDTQAAFDDVLAWLPPADLAADRVHVNQAGHTVLARALLRGLGFDWLRVMEAPSKVAQQPAGPGPASQG
jgi:lysophospholipase L1-like esterase